MRRMRRLFASCTAFGIGLVTMAACSSTNEDVRVDPFVASRIKPATASPTLDPAKPAPARPRDPSIPIAPAEHQRMLDYVNRKNDPRIVRKTIDDGEGEIVNCVEIRFQHGFDHPLNVTPSDDPAKPLPPSKQAYGSVGERCPHGTVPQLRTYLEPIEEYATLEDYFHRDIPSITGPTNVWQYAMMKGSLPSGGIKGAISTLNYWFPALCTPQPPYYVTCDREHTNAQMWVFGRPAISSGLTGFNVINTIETGWDRAPNFYSTYRGQTYYQPYYVHAWIFANVNSYLNNCFNLECNWFVQKSSYMTPGGYIPNTGGYMSTPCTEGYDCWFGYSTQREVTHEFFYSPAPDPPYANAWHFYWNGVYIGYYPASLFGDPGLLYGGAKLDVGGEVQQDTQPAPDGPHPGQHTGTDMGSGSFVGTNFSTSFGVAAYHRQIMVWPMSGSSYQYAYDSTYVSDSTVSPQSHCYDALYLDYTQTPSGFGNALFFGGPGYSNDCQ